MSLVPPVRSLVRASSIIEGMVVVAPDHGLITVANLVNDGSTVQVTNRVFDRDVDLPVASYPVSSMVPCAVENI